MAELDCTSTFTNIHKLNCDQLYSSVYAVLLDKVNTGVATVALAETEATWTTKLNAAEGSRTYVMKEPDSVEWDNEDIQFNEGNSKRRKKMRSGTRRLKMSWWDATRDMFNAYKTFDGATMYAYVITENGMILAGSEDDTKFTPNKVEVFVDNEKQPNGISENWSLDVYLDFLQPDSMNAKVARPLEASPAWDAREIDGIVDVLFTQVSASASSVVVDCNGAWDNREVTGFVTADFTVTGLSSVSGSGNRYTLTPTSTFTSPLTVTLANQPTMTTKGYENQTAATVTWS